jgi:Mce-associated membrane protein
VVAKVTVTRVAIVLLVAAAAFAGWAGWSWIRASGDDALGYAAARDEALRVGRQEVAELTTLDYHDVDAGIARWLRSATGPLHDQLAGTDVATRNSLRQGGTVATGAVLDAAISELDNRAGIAKLLVSVEITTAKAGTPPATKRNRFAAALTRTDAGWKLSALDQVPLGTR